MTRVFVAGGVTFNSLIYLDTLPDPQPDTVFSQRFNETVGGTAAGKAFNLNRLGLDTTLHGLVGDDAPGEMIRAMFAHGRGCRGVMHHIPRSISPGALPSAGRDGIRKTLRRLSRFLCAFYSPHCANVE